MKPSFAPWIDFLGQLHFQREVVDLLQAGDLLGLALLDLGRARDHADKPRAGIGLGAVHDASEAPDDVVGGHPAAMVEISVVAQLEGMNKTSVRDGDLPGELRNRLAFSGVPSVERPVQGLGEYLVLGALCRMNVHAA